MTESRLNGNAAQSSATARKNNDGRDSGLVLANTRSSLPIELPLPPLPLSTSTQRMHFDEEFQRKFRDYSSQESIGTDEEEDLDARAHRLCVGSKDFDIHSPIHSLENSSNSTPTTDENNELKSRLSNASLHGAHSSIGDMSVIRKEIGKLVVDEEMYNDGMWNKEQTEERLDGKHDGEETAEGRRNYKLKKSQDPKKKKSGFLAAPRVPILHPILSQDDNNDGKGKGRIWDEEQGAVGPIPSKVSHENVKQWRFLRNDELPSLNIVIMLVGTHGDVLPFVGFAQSLREHGHRVRIATHECHRGLVLSRKVEFYPLAGNPKVLSQFMVKTGGTVYGSARNPKFLASNTRMVKEIIKSTWKACTEIDPNDPEETPFLVDAIVSNPATMGHIHVAEALGVPLHIMFPQPWYYGK